MLGYQAVFKNDPESVEMHPNEHRSSLLFLVLLLCHLLCSFSVLLLHVAEEESNDSFVVVEQVAKVGFLEIVELGLV